MKIQSQIKMMITIKTPEDLLPDPTRDLNLTLNRNLN